MSVVLAFVDGLGLAPAGPSNPLSGTGEFLRDVVPPPGLTAELLAGGEGLRLETGLPGVPACAVALDATLGVEGLPQSATGQTSLFTGCNAANRLGRHLSGFPTPTLLRLLEAGSIFRRAREAGLKATFANPFPAGYFEAVATRRRRHATTTAAILAGGYSLRSFRDLVQGRAVCHDITGAVMADRGFAVEPVTPEEAGVRLAALTRDHDLVLFEYFLTDRAGHACDVGAARRCLQELGRFLQACMDRLDLRRDTLVLVSDHGNVEDLGVRTHTRNPVPGVAIGAASHRLLESRCLTDVAPAILAMLGGGEGNG